MTIGNLSGMPLPSATRGAILDAARAALAAEGQSASMRRIAARAGITHAAIYKHFSDKDALFSAIAERDFAELVERIRDSVPVTGSPRDRLHAVLASFIEAGLDNPNLYEFLFWTLPAEHGAVARTNDVFLLLQAAVRECGPADSAEGEYSEQLAGFLLTAAIGYVARRFVRPTTARARIGDYVTFLLGGLT